MKKARIPALDPTEYLYKTTYYEKKTAIAALAGIVFGILGARYLFAGWALSLIPWGITGLLLGVWRRNDPQAVITCAACGIGLALAAAFLCRKLARSSARN